VAEVRNCGVGILLRIQTTKFPYATGSRWS